MFLNTKRHIPKQNFEGVHRYPHELSHLKFLVLGAIVALFPLHGKLSRRLSDVLELVTWLESCSHAYHSNYPCCHFARIDYHGHSFSKASNHNITTPKKQSTTSKNIID